MLVVACVKQVPDTTQVKIDPVTNTLIREGGAVYRQSLRYSCAGREPAPEGSVRTAGGGPFHGPAQCRRHPAQGAGCRRGSGGAALGPRVWRGGYAGDQQGIGGGHRETGNGR